MMVTLTRPAPYLIRLWPAHWPDFCRQNDRVKWFSNSDRVFPRTRSVIGRPVIRCHPLKSIDKVLKILDDFHKGYTDSEDFWIKVHGHTIYLCFYAVRDNQDNYLGSLETVQDITKFKAITPVIRPWKIASLAGKTLVKRTMLLSTVLFWKRKERKARDETHSWPSIGRWN